MIAAHTMRPTRQQASGGRLQVGMSIDRDPRSCFRGQPVRQRFFRRSPGNGQTCLFRAFAQVQLPRSTHAIDGQFMAVIFLFAQTCLQLLPIVLRQRRLRCLPREQSRQLIAVRGDGQTPLPPAVLIVL
ncbi:hypothetical protein DY467_25730 [Rhodopseudomonas sp. BR0G17]|nr:hypothetical protein [Rhodopseudomonas sp. BR0G17]